jgi:hypothetical protein
MRHLEKCFTYISWNFHVDMILYIYIVPRYFACIFDFGIKERKKGIKIPHTSWKKLLEVDIGIGKAKNGPIK